MPSSHTLPDDPVYAFCPSYDLDNVPQQIRIVFDNMPGYVPTALFALHTQMLRATFECLCCGGRYVAVTKNTVF